MYVHDPALADQWRDVEITMYFMRHARLHLLRRLRGHGGVARTNHGTTGPETRPVRHPRPQRAHALRRPHRLREGNRAPGRTRPSAPGTCSPGHAQIDVWLGYKFVVFDQPDGVHLELWLDRTGGVDGAGELVNQMVDDGNVFGDVACAPGSRTTLMNDGYRVGSESGRPNVSVYFRSDYIGRDGLVYKWGSVREIVP